MPNAISEMIEISISKQLSVCLLWAPSGHSLHVVRRPAVRGEAALQFETEKLSFQTKVKVRLQRLIEAHTQKRSQAKPVLVANSSWLRSKKRGRGLRSRPLKIHAKKL